MSNPPLPWSSKYVQSLLPHAYPFVLVDMVMEYEKDSRIVTRKCVSCMDPYFPGHFPGTPIMPGVLQLEALAQSGALLVLANPKYAGKIIMLTSANNFKFRRPVVPGEVLDMVVENIRLKGSFGKGDGRAMVNGEVTAGGELGFAIVDRSSLGI